MKNLIYYLLLVSTAIITIGCKKKTVVKEEVLPVNTELINGLPNWKKQNGYLFSIFSRSQYANSSNNPTYGYTQYALFNDPEKIIAQSINHTIINFYPNFLANISVGKVTHNNNVLAQTNGGSSVTYYKNNSGQIINNNTPTTWTTEGNQSFKPLNITIARGYPVIPI